jgi:hypothetical protein
MSSTNYFAPSDDSGLTKSEIIMKTRNSKLFGEQVMVEGLMTFGMLETGQRTLDFACCEDVEAEPFKGDFHVQGMRDGNVYMQEKLKRKKNKPIFRDDNSSFSFGHDRKYYFFFSMDEALLEQLPERLVRQASAIAQKVLKEIIHKG